jgi:hypothetical protein
MIPGSNYVPRFLRRWKSLDHRLGAPSIWMFGTPLLPPSLVVKEIDHLPDIGMASILEQRTNMAGQRRDRYYRRRQHHGELLLSPCRCEAAR